MSGRSIGYLCLVITSVGWALNWPLIKVILQDWPPLFARGLAGVRRSTLVVNLPSDPGELTVGLRTIVEVLPQAVRGLSNRPASPAN